MKKQITDKIKIFIIVFYVGILSLTSYSYGHDRGVKDSQMFKMLEPIANNTYVPETYDCKNFTADAISILKENNVEAEPYCYIINETAAHAVVKISLYLEPQNNTIINNITLYNQSECGKIMMGMIK